MKGERLSYIIKQAKTLSQCRDKCHELEAKVERLEAVVRKVAGHRTCKIKECAVCSVVYKARAALGEGDGKG